MGYATATASCVRCFFREGNWVRKNTTCRAIVKFVLTANIGTYKKISWHSTLLGGQVGQATTVVTRIRKLQTQHIMPLWEIAFPLILFLGRQKTPPFLPNPIPICNVALHCCSGLQILYSLLKSMEQEQAASSFYKTYYTTIIQHVLSVVTDTSHAAGKAATSVLPGPSGRHQHTSEKPAFPTHIRELCHTYTTRGRYLSAENMRLTFTTMCKLALTINFLTCCFTFQTLGLARQNYQVWLATFFLIGRTNNFAPECLASLFFVGNCLAKPGVWNVKQQVKLLQLMLACEW